MRFALRTAVCSATIVAALWPTKAIGDEAALKRTAPEECIAWFSWAGFDALATGDSKTNRTEQLLADEEVRAFLDSIAKNLGGAIAENSDENTKQMAQLARVLGKRPAVAFLSRISEVKREAPPTAPEPPTTPPQAAVVPTIKTTVGEDGLERIGIDFDVQVTAGDLPAASSAARAVVPAVAEQLEVQVAPASPPRFGRTRKTIVDGKPRTEVEVHYPHGTQWQEIDVDFDFDIDDNRPSNDSADERVPESTRALPIVGNLINAVETAAWAAQQSNANPTSTTNASNDAVGVELEDGRVGIEFGPDLDGEKPANLPQMSSAEWYAAQKQLTSKLQAGFQPSTAPAARATHSTPVVAAVPPTGVPANGEVKLAPKTSSPAGAEFPTPPPPPYVAAPIVGPPNIPSEFQGPPPATPVCSSCTTCSSCNASTTVSVVHGAVVVDLGEHFTETKALYDKLAADGPELPKQKIDEVEFTKIVGDQPMWLAFSDAYVIVAFDEASAEQCVNGLAGKREVPKWLVDAEAKLPVERPAARLHVNIDGITKLVDEPFEEPSKEFVKLLGLDQVSAISFVAGLDDQGTAIKTLIATRDGANVSAVLDFFGDKGLTAADLKVIPKDATMAAAGKIDVKKIVELGVQLAVLEVVDAESAWDETKKYLAEHLFIDLSKDIVEAIGDTWTLHYAPSEGGLMATTFTLAVRDEAKLKATIEKLALISNAEADGRLVRRFDYRGQQVYYFSFPDMQGNFSWCIKDGRLVASMLPQTIKAHIARGPLKETLADVPEVAKLFPKFDAETPRSRSSIDKQPSAGPINLTGPLVLSYTDTRGILEWCYQYGSFLLPTIGSALAQSEEIGFALHEIPSLAVIEQYFGPSITTVSRTDGGLLVDSRQTVPMMPGLLFSLAAASTFEHALGGPLGMADLESVVDAAASIAEMPLSISAAPSPYWHQDDVQYFPPPGEIPPPPLPPQSKPGPWTPGTAALPLPPTSYATPVPYGTPVPYHVPGAVGQPYVAPPATPPNVPANYLKPTDKPIGVPAPAGMPHSTPIGLPPPPAAAIMKPGDSYPKAPPAAVAANPGVPSAYSVPTPNYPPAPPAPPVAAAYAAPYVPGYTTPAATPGYAPAVSGGVYGGNPYATAPAAKSEPPASEPTTAKPAAEAKPTPSGRTPRRLLRRRAAVPRAPAPEGQTSAKPVGDANQVCYVVFEDAEKNAHIASVNLGEIKTAIGAVKAANADVSLNGKNIWIARPSVAGAKAEMLLPVQWAKVPSVYRDSIWFYQEARPGDRIFVSERSMPPFVMGF